MARPQRAPIRFDFVGVTDAHRRTLISALNSVSGQLGVAFEHVNGQAGELLFVGVDDLPTVQRYTPPNVAVISFGDRRTHEGADVVRPIRVAQLTTALERAVAHIDQASAEAASEQATSGRPRMYRGAPVEESRSATTAERERDQKPRAGLVYRGSRVG